MRKEYFLIWIMAFFVMFSCENEDSMTDPGGGDNNGDGNNSGSQLDASLLVDLQTASGGIGTSYFKFPDSDDYVNIPQDPLNPITSDKVELGKLLFHETATGGNPRTAENLFTYSCASCHHADAGFGAGVRQGIGEGGIGFGTRGEGRVLNPDLDVEVVDIQPIKSPTILNSAFQHIMLWNGQFGATGPNVGTEDSWAGIPENGQGFQGLEVQALKGQDVHRLLIDENFVDNFNYRSLFDAAFPDVPQAERYTRETAGLAIAAFERTVLANESPWQRWLKGDTDALSDNEKRGARLFFGKAKCYECHTGPALNDENFYAFGMDDFFNSPGVVVTDVSSFQRVARLGRGGFTNDNNDRFKFKTPTLYNLIDNGQYGHGASFTDVTDVVVYKLNGDPQKNIPRPLLSETFLEVQELTDSEIDDLVLFLENGLRDPNLDRYVSGVLNSGNFVSRIMMSSLEAI